MKFSMNVISAGKDDMLLIMIKWINLGINISNPMDLEHDVNIDQ